MSTSKTKWIIFNKGTPERTALDLTVNKDIIPRVNIHCFLGILLDHNLNGRQHLKHLIGKGRKIADIVSTLSSITWGSHSGLLLTVYKATFHSAVEYGCQFFGVLLSQTLLSSNVSSTGSSGKLWATEFRCQLTLCSPRPRSSTLTTDSIILRQDLSIRLVDMACLIDDSVWLMVLSWRWRLRPLGGAARSKPSETVGSLDTLWPLAMKKVFVYRSTYPPALAFVWNSVAGNCIRQRYARLR